MSDTVIQKLKSFYLKRKNLDEEVLYVFCILQIVSFLVKIVVKGNVKVEGKS